jgi:hypothetical protein
MPKCHQKVKNCKGPDFFFQRPFFPLDWPESYAKSWQQLCAGGVHLCQIEEGEDMSGLAGQ